MKPNESGFTLVELMVASFITMIIMGACAASLILMLRNVDATQKRLSESHDAQMTAAYFANDVQSSDLQSASPRGIQSATLSCATAETTPLATFTSTTDSGVITTKYLLKTVGVGVNAERQLQRTQGAEKQVLAHRVKPCTGATDTAVTITTATATGPNHYLLTVNDIDGLTYRVTGEKRVR